MGSNITQVGKWKIPVMDSLTLEKDTQCNILVGLLSNYSVPESYTDIFFPKALFTLITIHKGAAFERMQTVLHYNS